MRITKHGNKWYHFVCRVCGCEWDAGREEGHQGTVAPGGMLKKVMFLFFSCPKCGHDTCTCEYEYEKGDAE